MSAAPPLHESPADHIPNSNAIGELWTCRRCFLELPLESFRIRFKATGERHKTCKACFNRYRREKLRPRYRANDLSKSVTALASTENRDDVQLLAAVVRQMIRRFGGFERMCDEWATHTKALAERRPGCRLILKTYQAVFQLMATVEAVEREKTNQAGFDVTKLSSIELSELIGNLAGVDL